MTFKISEKLLLLLLLLLLSFLLFLFSTNKIQVIKEILLSKLKKFCFRYFYSFIFNLKSDKYTVTFLLLLLLFFLIVLRPLSCKSNQSRIRHYFFYSILIFVLPLFPYVILFEVKSLRKASPFSSLFLVSSSYRLNSNGNKDIIFFPRTIQYLFLNCFDF